MLPLFPRHSGWITRGWITRGSITRAWRTFSAVLLLASLALPGLTPALAAPPALPQTSCALVVSTNADTGIGSLREQLGCATDGQTVTFNAGLAGQTISLTSGEIATTQSITIDASAAPGVIVDAGNSSRIFNLQTAGTVTITGLILQHASSPASQLGGAIVSFSSQIVLNQVQVLSNTADVQGGGIFAAESVTVTNGLFQGNTCTGTSCIGGGIYAGNLTLSSTNFISNTSTGDGAGAASAGFGQVMVGRFERNTCSGSNCRGGGLYASTTLQVTSADFLTNTTQGSGGGAFANGAVTLVNDQFRGNTCAAGSCTGGGLTTYNSLTAAGTDFISNTSQGDGGGANIGYITQMSGGRFERNICQNIVCTGGGMSAYIVVITDTQFLTNTSGNHGGGLYVNHGAVLTGARFAGNSCQLSGCTAGGLRVGQTLTLLNTDFISNTSQGSGGAVAVGGPTILTNTLFLRNTCVVDCRGGALATGDSLAATDSEFISNTSYIDGGALSDVYGAITLTNSLLQDNLCVYAFCAGGGVYVGRNLYATNTDFLTNTSQYFGGGVAAYGDVTLTGGRFQGNRCEAAACRGGGLWAYSNSALSGARFISNTSNSSGGGIFATGSVTATGGSFERNRCSQAACVGGGLSVSGTLALSGTQLLTNTSQGLGGGLYAALAASLANSSFSGNSAGSGGGLAALAGLAAANLTLAGNTAQTAGGGLYLADGANAQLVNLTLADNTALSGGALYASALATVGVSNTLISNSGAAACAGLIDFGTHNLEWASTSCAVVGPTAGFANADPLLGPLALNAPGATLTQALLLNSPARDTGDAATCAGPLVNNRDQRGVTRPINGDAVAGAVCDIGAYEAPVPVWFLYLPILRR